MKYYIIAGEASGDLHGSNLMKGLKEEDHDSQFRFWGGDLMAAQGGELVMHYKKTAVMGFVEVLGSLRQITKNLKLCKEDILSYSPDLIILIDYPGFNFRIAQFAKEHGFKIFYYIAPKVWAWKESRVKKLKKFVDKLFIIFPFEIDYFKKHGIDAVYRGNPLLDSVADHPYSKELFEDFCRRNNLEDKPIIGLLPGSRMMEINYLMPKMVQLEREFPNHQFVLAAAPSISIESYQNFLANTNIKLLTGESYSIMKHADVTVLASGTASLEAALLDAPQVVCYGGNEISFQIAKRLVKVKYVSLVNIILDSPVVKELLQHDCTPEKITAEVKRLLEPKNAKKVKKQYNKLKVLLGGEGASVKVAKAMIQEHKSLIESKIYNSVIETPIGALLITANERHLLSVLSAEASEYTVTQEDPKGIIEETKRQLIQYFNGEREEFDLPINPIGTEFQTRVWGLLREIPFGKVVSYGEIATKIGGKNASRAVGMACKTNPLLIITPCHRVIGANNKLVGFNIGLDKKSYLLNHENASPNVEGNLFNQ